MHDDLFLVFTLQKVKIDTGTHPLRTRFQIDLHKNDM